MLNTTYSLSQTNTMSTKEFAGLILRNPGYMYSFSFKERMTEGDIWFGVVNAKIFDVQSIFINKLSIIGGAAYVFDIPNFFDSELYIDYDDEDIDSDLLGEQDDNCYVETIEGLNRFLASQNGTPNLWFVKTRDVGILNISYHQ